MADGEDTTTTEQKPVDPMRGLKRANKTLTQEREALKARVAALEDEAKQAKLTAEEKTLAELDKLRKERDSIAAEAAKARQDRENERLISQLVARHGLRDPEFGEIVLKQKPDDQELDEFVTEIKKSQRFGVLFGVREDTEDEVIPRAPRKSPANNSGQKVAQAELEIEAQSLYPGDEARQQAYVRNVLSLGRGR